MKTLLRYDFHYFFKTPKWIVLGALSLFLSALSVLTARYMNTLLEYVLRSEGIEDVTLPEVTVMEAYRQYFSNHFQLFLLVALFLAVHLFTHDFQKHHSAFLFAKPIRTIDYLFAKTAALLAVLLGSLVIGVLVFAYYTHHLFDTFALFTFFKAFLVYLVALFFFVQLALFLSALCKQFLAPLLLTLVVFFVLSSLSMFSGGVFAWIPSQLFILPEAIMAGEATFFDAFRPVFITLGLAVGLFFLSNEVLKRTSLV